MSARSIKIISAGAGSGKTYQLCEEYLGCVQQNTIAPTEILTTTFTRLAAMQLASRLRFKLLQAGMSAAAVTVENGWIGTVHSVCLNLLKNFALDRGISPDLEPLPDGDSEFIFAQATTAIMEECAGSLSRLEENLELREPWQKTVQEICKKARANGMGPEAVRAEGARNAKGFREILPQMLTDKDWAKRQKWLKTQLDTALSTMREAEELARQASKEGKKKLTNTAEKYLHALESSCANLEKNDSWPVWREISKLPSPPKRLVKEANALLEELGEIHAELVDTAAGYQSRPDFQKDSTDYISLLFDCAARCLDAFAETKKVYGLLDYEDMEFLALEMLRDPNIADILRGRIRQVFVDEFQDTSPLQLALFLRLSEIAQASVWVGDTKQAIYGYRGSDPVLMHTVSTQIGKSEDGSRMQLKKSWRSVPALVSFTNAFFVRAFKAFGYTKTTVALNPAREDSVSQKPVLRFWIDQASNKDEHCAKLAAHIHEALHSKKFDYLGDPEDLEEVALTAKDIAVLCRTNAECSSVAAALNNLGLEVDLDLSEMERAPELSQLKRQPEVVLCLAIYRYCTRREDTISLLEIRRLLEPELPAWLDQVLEGGRSVLEEAVTQTDLGPALAALRSKLPHYSPSEALRQAASAMDSIRQCASWGGSEKRLANLDMLFARAKQYEEFCRIRHEACTHTGCISWLLEDEQAVVANGISHDAVHVLTYHKSKGLEWPVVILFSLGHSPREYNCFDLNMMPPDEYINLDDPLQGRKIHYWPWPAGKDRTLREELKKTVDAHENTILFRRQAVQEELRLLYVGMTRAREILVFSLQSSEDVVQDNWIRAVLPTDAAESIGLPTAKDSFFHLATEKFPALLETLPDTFGQRMRPEEIRLRPISLPIPPDPYLLCDFPPAEMEPSTLGPDRSFSGSFETMMLTGQMQWRGEEPVSLTGSIMHAWLCLDLPGLLSSEARQERLELFKKQWKIAEEDAAELPALRERLSEALEVLAEKRGFGRILNYKVEWPLTEKRDGSILTGRLDMLVECEKGCILVDHKYKSQDGSEEMFKAQVREYSGQLSAYVSALAKAGKKRLIACLHLPLQGVLLMPKFEQYEHNEDMEEEEVIQKRPGNRSFQKPGIRPGRDGESEGEKEEQRAKRKLGRPKQMRSVDAEKKVMDEAQRDESVPSKCCSEDPLNDASNLDRIGQWVARKLRTDPGDNRTTYLLLLKKDGSMVTHVRFAYEPETNSSVQEYLCLDSCTGVLDAKKKFTAQEFSQCYKNVKKKIKMLIEENLKDIDN